jgi:hypothetical protein
LRLYWRVRVDDKSVKNERGVIDGKRVDQKRFVFNKVTGQLVLTRIPSGFQKPRRAPWLVTGTISPTRVYFHEGSLPKTVFFYQALRNALAEELSLETPITRRVLGGRIEHGVLGDFILKPAEERGAPDLASRLFVRLFGKPPT